MEKIIYLPKDESIISAKELEYLNEEGSYDGITLVKKGKKIVGSVHFLDTNQWHLETFNAAKTFDCFEDIISSYPEYTFVYITEE
jgi:hypothetical protein